MGLSKDWYLTHRHPRIGKHHTDEQKNNISNGIKKGFMNGRIVWNKGKTKYNDARLAAYSQHPIFKNKERNEKIRRSKLGKKRLFNDEWRKNLGKANIRIGKWKGKNNPAFIDGLTKPYISKTHGIPHYEWKAIRRNFLKTHQIVCAICGKQPTPPVIDHVIPYRCSYDNAETNLQILCRACHAKKDIHWEGVK